jgi:hypothetical protein
MKGLDNWIMGINDPNAPFNQIDWCEEFESVLEHCDWLNNQTLEIDRTYEMLEKLMYDSACVILNLDNRHYTAKEKHQALTENAEKIAIHFSDLVAEKIKSEQAKWMYVVAYESCYAPKSKFGHIFVCDIDDAKLFKNTTAAYNYIFKNNSYFKGLSCDVIKLLFFL